MKNVASIFGKPHRSFVPFDKVEWPLPEQLIGIEIEVETMPGVVFPENLLPYWKQERDGSLRNGVEYILCNPLKGDTLSAAVAAIFHQSAFCRSTTGSTHIHIDMMEENTTGETVKVMVLLAYILEPAVFGVFDPGREWCGYTNKLSSAPDALLGSVLAASDATDYNELRLVANDGCRTGRYYGLNLLALREHGSIEFRYFPTATCQEEVVEWVSLVQSFKKAALEISTVTQLLEIMGDADRYESFLLNYFGQWKTTFMDYVSHYAANGALQKALAVASAYTGRNTSEWDYTSVSENKRYSKFIKKSSAQPRSGTLHLIAPSQSLPTRPARGDVLVYAGDMYFGAANQGSAIISWTPLDNVMNGRYQELSSVRRLLHNQREAITNALALQGAGAQRIIRAVGVLERLAAGHVIEEDN